MVARGRAFRAMLAKIALNKNRLDSGLVHSGSISIIGAEITHHPPCLVFVVTRRFPLDDIERHCTPILSCRSEEHTSELQSLIRNSYAVICLKQNKKCIFSLYN